MKSDILIDKWARMKLKEYDVTLPDEDNLISVDFDTAWVGGCETCAFEYDIVVFSWNYETFTIDESYDLGAILREIIDSGLDNEDVV